MTAYIVTDGEYEGYEVEAVFLDRADAEAFVEEVSIGRRLLKEGHRVCPNIEEYEIGEKRGWVSQVIYKCVTYEDGTLNWASSITTAQPPGYTSTTREPNGMFVCESSVSADHARKLCAEARQKWLREQAAVEAIDVKEAVV